MKFKRVLSIALGFIFFGQIIFSVPAYASYCDSTGNGGGRAACEGYFTGDNSDAANGHVFNILSGGIYPSLKLSDGSPRSLSGQANSFEAKIKAYLDGGGSDAIGAAFIIANSYGVKGTAFSSTAEGIAWAQARFADWSSIVDEYAANNMVDFSTTASFGSAYRNSAYFSDINDDAFHEHSAEDITVIRFNNADGTYFRIEKSCGNLVGSLGRLRHPVTDDWTATATSSVVPYAVRGQTVTWTHTVNVAGTKGSADESGWLRWTNSSGTVLTYVGSGTGRAGKADYSTSINAGNAYTYPSNVKSQFTIPNSARDGDKYCQQITFSDKAWNDDSNGNSATDCVTVTVPTPLSLTPKVFGIVNYEAGAGGTLTAHHSVDVTPPCNRTLAVPGSPVTITWSIGGTDGGANGNHTLSYTNCQAAFSTPTIDSTIAGAVLDGKGPGYSFNRTSTINGVTATSSGIVYSVPYTRFYGNDIYASGCGTDANNGTIGFNTKVDDVTNLAAAVTGSAAGSAVEYAAFALKDSAGVSKLNHISSGVYNNYPIWPTAPSPSPFLRLSSNFVAGKMVCPATILSSVTNALPDNSNITTTAVNTYNVYAANGGIRGFLDANTTNLKITATGGNSATAAKQTIYANDVYINNDISLGVPSPFDPTTAPVLLIVAKGNVYIDKSVGTIQAIIVAGGTIYTCADNSVPAAYTAGNLNGNCDNPLTVNGSLVAQNIKFGRTYGTRLCAAAYDVTANSSCTPKALGTPAEVISYPAYMHFTSPYLKDTAGSTFPAIFNPAPYF
jgi:hypothetical protein